MKGCRWVRQEVVLAVHDRQIAEHGGLPGVRDQGALEAALARPRHRAAYKRADAAVLAASYAYGVIRNHPFEDGNKRTGWVAARLFLADNGVHIHFDAVDAVRTVEAVASGTLSESALAGWFRKRVVRQSRGKRS